MANKKNPCSCCGYMTLEKDGMYGICPVCFWQDDPIQADDDEYEGGANDISLKTAQDNFSRIGAMAKDYLSDVRAPNPDELPDLE